MLKSTRAKVVSRLIGATALAVAIAAGPIAGPASAAELNQFAGTGTGYALRVTLDLRDTLLEDILTPVLGPVVEAVSGKPFTGVIDQYFIKTSSEADASNNKARSALAEGLINLDVVEATNIGQTVEKTVQNIALPSEDLSIISGTVGNLLASVLGGPNVAGTGELENLAVGLPIEDLGLPALDDLLDGVLGDLLDDVQVVLEDVLGGAGLGDLVNQLTGPICDLTGQAGLGGLLGELGLGEADLCDTEALVPALTALLDIDALLELITGLLGENLLSGNLAELQGLINITGTQKTADSTKAVAGSAASLQSLKVLGGLVDVSLLNLKSTSEAGGVPGSAKNTSDCSIADVSIGGGALDISLDGSSISIGGQEIPLPIAEIKALVDGLLNALGIDVGLCETADVSAAADGRSASQSVSALRVEVAPLNLFRLVIDPTVQTAVAAQVGTESTSTPDAPNPTLPRTGAGMAVSIFGGLGLALAAIMIRRRFV
jgi:hypothetical protein